MSKVRYNGVADALQGRMGVVVFRRMLGKLFASNRPNESSKPLTAAQIAHRDTFAKAAGDARDALADPDARLVYERLAAARQSTAFGVAMKDVFNPPEVLEVDLTGFTYAAGGVIKVRARDDAEVKAVDIALRTASGTPIEQGGAVLTGSYWYYNTTTVIPAGTLLALEVTALDWAGNTGAKTVNYP